MSMHRKNDVTGAELVTKAATNQYRDGWDRIFGNKKKEVQPHVADHCTDCNASQMVLPDGEHRCGEELSEPGVGDL